MFVMMIYEIIDVMKSWKSKTRNSRIASYVACLLNRRNRAI